MKISRATTLGLALTPALALGLSLAACGGGSSSLPASGPRTCWNTGTGVVDETVEAPGQPTLPCSATYELAAAGGPYAVSSPPQGMGSPACVVSFPTITWQVWSTGGLGTAANLCASLRADG